MYKEGPSLKSGLIDETRLFSVITRVKQLADSSKLVNYEQVREYTSTLPTSGSKHSERKWDECVQFMRENPKLMLRMLDESSDSEREF